MILCYLGILLIAISVSITVVCLLSIAIDFLCATYLCRILLKIIMFTVLYFSIRVRRADSRSAQEALDA